MSNLPWIEKYRPNQLDELISHDDIIQTLQNSLSKGSLPHLLFYGPPGTGKTSTILAIAKQIYTPRELKSNVLELNSSDERGIGTVRSEIMNFASNKQFYSNKYRIIILDEADAMTKDAQNALRRIMEKYTETTRFCIVGNYVNKIIPALRSRCTVFRFPPLQPVQMRPRLEHIVQQEGLTLKDAALDALIQLSSGDMRQAINVLQSTSMAFDEVTEDSIYACAGQPLPSDMTRLMGDLLNDNLNTAIDKLAGLRLEKGYALRDIVTELHNLLLKMDMPDVAALNITIGLADVEERLAAGCSEKLQASSVAAVFCRAKADIAAANN